MELYIVIVLWIVATICVAVGAKDVGRRWWMWGLLSILFTPIGSACALTFVHITDPEPSFTGYTQWHTK